MSYLQKNTKQEYELHNIISKRSFEQAMDFAKSLQSPSKAIILTSMFPNGFTPEFTEQLKRLIVQKNSFVFVASEFEKNHEETEEYFKFFLSMFHEIGIYFEQNIVIDSRVEKEEAKKLVENADVVWLSGGDTPKQYEYFKKYELISAIQNRTGITIGMSAGSINLTKVALCTRSCGHTEQVIYPALGMIDFSIEPHFDPDHVSEELLTLSEQYTIYGMCDDSVILMEKEHTTYLGDIYLIHNHTVRQLDLRSE